MIGQLLDLLGRAEEMRDFLEKLQDLLDSSKTMLELDVEEHLQTANDICKLIVFARAMSEHYIESDEIDESVVKFVETEDLEEE